MVAMATMFGMPADGVVTVANARDWFRVSVTYTTIANRRKNKDDVPYAG
jgi:hypothetical protein